ncbi:MULTISPECIES: hypothetical protein [unclassified Moorena]|uniref:hypothetical protein n=1 Tax=unclassified Moorena TaxID=2683338 RepID=UPI0013BE75AC|nr:MULTISPECIES: hypothetical protein [unclassified Moorena]NEQ08706.1 hypothetical protein [Moorena sp. SIO4E2]NES46864.1 hypothetical protein [Moorena sp. SIO2C4]
MVRYGTGSHNTDYEVENAGKPAPNAPYSCSRFPIPDSRFPTPDSPLPKGICYKTFQNML